MSILLPCVLAACATVQNGGVHFAPFSFKETAQKGALSRAQRAYRNKDFDTCIERLDRAETYGTYSKAVSFQIAFGRGLCLDGLGRSAEARAIYASLAEKYADSEWGARAKARIETENVPQLP